MADIQPGRRLVQQHNRRFLRQHHRDPRALTLPAGEGVHALLGELGNTRRLHRSVHRLVVLLAPAGKQRLVRIAPAGDQLLHGNIPRRGGVLRQQPNSARNLFAGEALDLLPVEEHAALNRRHQAAQRAQQCRFAAAVWPDNGGEVAVRNGNG